MHKQLEENPTYAQTIEERFVAEKSLVRLVYRRDYMILNVSKEMCLSGVNTENDKTCQMPTVGV